MTEQMTPKEKASQLIVGIAGYAPSSMDKLVAMSFCEQKVKEAESEEDKDFWEDTIFEIYMYGREFN